MVSARTEESEKVAALDSGADDYITSALVDQGLYTFMPESRSFRYNDEGGKYTIAPLITSYDSAVGEPYGGTSDDPEEESGQLLLAAPKLFSNSVSSTRVVFPLSINPVNKYTGISCAIIALLTFLLGFTAF